MLQNSKILSSQQQRCNVSDFIVPCKPSFQSSIILRLHNFRFKPRIVSTFCTLELITKLSYSLKNVHFIKRFLYYCQHINTRFFISNTFISNTRLKFAKNQANAKKHPEAELSLFENYSHSSSTLLSKNNMTYSKIQVKEQFCLYS